MKKWRFTMEVLLTLSALPFFLGMAMSWKCPINKEVSEEILQQSTRANSNAYAKFPVAF